MHTGATGRAMLGPGGTPTTEATATHDVRARGRSSPRADPTVPSNPFSRRVRVLLRKSGALRLSLQVDRKARVRCRRERTHRMPPAVAAADPAVAPTQASPVCASSAFASSAPTIARADFASTHADLTLTCTAAALGAAGPGPQPTSASATIATATIATTIAFASTFVRRPRQQVYHHGLRRPASFPMRGAPHCRGGGYIPPLRLGRDQPLLPSDGL
jgi:hypothetical protein